MDGIHDLGGKHGYGQVDVEDAGPPLPERWQGFVFTMINQLLRNGTAANVDHFRHAVERIRPNAYLEDGYYGRWLGAGETLLAEAGIVAQEEINSRVAQGLAKNEPVHPPAARPSDRTVTRANPSEVRLPTAERKISHPPSFSVGEQVRTLAHGRPGHTRLPAYARGSLGTIVSLHNAWVYPDTNAHGEGEAPEYLYTVSFVGTELFGEDCEPDLEVCLDLFEPYLRSVS